MADSRKPSLTKKVIRGLALLAPVVIADIETGWLTDEGFSGKKNRENLSDVKRALEWIMEIEYYSDTKDPG